MAVPLLGVGSAAFVVSFATIAFAYARPANLLGGIVFVVVYVTWGLYGACALLPDEPKNVGYNTLDVVSKNAFGVFVAAYAWTR